MFSLTKKGAGADPKKSAPAQILNRLQLQPKNHGSDRLRLRPATAPQHRSEWRIFVLNLTHFDSFLSNIYMFESIRIGNKDPDQYKAPEYTDPIRIHSSETYVLAHLQKLDA